MMAMNARAKLDHVPQGDVAAGFLRDTFGTVAAHIAGTSAPRMILARTAEHLALVGASLLVAILFGVPLGIPAAKRRRVGQVVLAVVGVIQIAAHASRCSCS